MQKAINNLVEFFGLFNLRNMTTVFNDNDKSAPGIAL